jgi:hypothetical protein
MRKVKECIYGQLLHRKVEEHYSDFLGFRLTLWKKGSGFYNLPWGVGILWLVLGYKGWQEARGKEKSGENCHSTGGFGILLNTPVLRCCQTDL